MTVNYVKDMLRNCGDGLDAGMRQLALDDAKSLHGMGVSSDRERNLVFYLDNFLDDLCSEMGRPAPEDRWKVIKSAYSNLKEKNSVDLTDIRRAVAFALGMLKRKKLAYPNISGVAELDVPKPRNLDKWVGALGEIFAAGRTGETREAVTTRLTEGWDPVETIEFRQWAKYYHSGDHEKYASLSKRAAATLSPDIPVTDIPEDMSEEDIPQSPVRTPKTPDDNKRSLVSRLDSAKRLLRLFAPPIWPASTWNRLYQGISDLEQEILGLHTASTMRDRIIKTATVWSREEGHASAVAEELLKIAQPPEAPPGSGGDVTGQIEKALTGKEYSTKAPAGGAGLGEDLGLDDMGADLGAPPEGEAGMPGGPEGGLPEGAPPGALDEMPEAPPPPESKEDKKPKSSDNPFSDSSVSDVLGVLEPLAKKMKERAQVRELSKADMMMEGLNIASYFPELGEAMARLIESNNYVSTRLEKIIGKLKGGDGGEGGDDKEGPPPIDMGGKPEETALEVGSSPEPKKKKPEETALEVGAPPAGGEGEPPPPPAGAVAPPPPGG